MQFDCADEHRQVVFLALLVPNQLMTEPFRIYGTCPDRG